MKASTVSIRAARISIAVSSWPTEDPRLRASESPALAPTLTPRATSFVVAARSRSNERNPESGIPRNGRPPPPPRSRPPPATGRELVQQPDGELRDLAGFLLCVHTPRASAPPGHHISPSPWPLWAGHPGQRILNADRDRRVHAATGPSTWSTPTGAEPPRAERLRLASRIEARKRVHQGAGRAMIER